MKICSSSRRQLNKHLKRMKIQLFAFATQGYNGFKSTEAWPIGRPAGRSVAQAFILFRPLYHFVKLGCQFLTLGTKPKFQLQRITHLNLQYSEVSPRKPTRSCSFGERNWPDQAGRLVLTQNYILRFYKSAAVYEVRHLSHQIGYGVRERQLKALGTFPVPLTCQDTSHQ